MLEYPVDITKTYTFKVDGKVTRRAKWPNDWGTPLEVEQVILLESMAPLPIAGVDYDPATHKLGPGEWIDDEVNQTAVWTRPIVQLTVEEIAERAAAADRQAKRTEVANAVAGLRSWADDAAGVTVNDVNHKTVTQTIVNRFGILCDRLADLIEGHFGR